MWAPWSGRVRRSPAFVAVSGVAALLLCLSCTSSVDEDTSGASTPASVGTRSTTDEPVVSQEVRDALADGVVTYDEYMAGFLRFSACVEASGYSLVVGEESNQVIDYSVPAEAVSSGVEAECYDTEFGPIDSSWQISREDGSETAELFRRCLRERGVEPADTLAEMDQQLTDAGISVADCLDG